MTRTSTSHPQGRRLRRDESVVGKQTFPVPRSEHPGLQDAFWVWARGREVFRQADHRGKLGDAAYRAQELGKALGAGTARTYRDLLHAAFRTYRNVRKRTTSPLRRKSADRVKTIKAAGSLEELANTILRANGVLLHNVLQKTFRRSGDAFVLTVTLKLPKSGDRRTIAQRVYERVKNRALVTYASVTNTPNGTDILVVNNPQKWNTRRTVDIYHLPLELATVPGVIEAACQALFSRTHMAVLDESMLPTLSGPMRDVNTRWRRYLRRQQAAGAIDFAQASPVWQEAQDTLQFAKTVGFYPEDLRGILRDLRRQHVVKCPHCGAPVTLELDPHTQAPLDGAVTCSECHVAVRVGILLGTRALTLCMDDWFHYGDTKRPQGLDHLKVAPSRQTTTKNETRKTRGSVPHRGRAELRT